MDVEFTLLTGAGNAFSLPVRTGPALARVFQQG